MELLQVLHLNKCLEFNPETGEYQPDGKKRRTEAKAIVLGRRNVMPHQQELA